jgi:HSP20 family protein
MASLIRWKPLRDLVRWHQDVDDLFHEFVEPIEFSEEEGCVCPRVESYRHNGSFVVKVDLPGVNPNDVHLTADQGCLTIEGERKRSEGIEEGAMLDEEVCYGSFKRSMAIPDGVKTDQIKAKYQDGVLEITAPVEEHYLPKKIEVEVLKN